MFERVSKPLTRVVAVVACLVVGVLVGGIISMSLRNHSASAQPGGCESDVCLWGSFCSDTPGSDTGCNRVDTGCKSYECNPN